MWIDNRMGRSVLGHQQVSLQGEQLTLVRVIDNTGVANDCLCMESEKVESNCRTTCSATSKCFAPAWNDSYGPTVMRSSGGTAGETRIRRRRLSALVVSLALGGALVLPSTSAQASSTGTGTDGGSTVRVGVSTGTTSDGQGGPTGVGAGGGRLPSPLFCMYTPIIDPPPIPNVGSWYSVICENRSTGVASAWNEFVYDRRAVTAQQVSPRSVALAAERSLRLPAPTSSFNPSGTSIVNLPTWMWIDANVWHQFKVTATVGSVSATAVATPIAVIWSTGDGSVTSCDGPGVPFQPAETSPVPAPGCSHTYTSTSIGQPSPDGNPNDGAFLVTTTIEWSVSWSSRGTAGGGSLPSLTTSSASRLRVEQVESIDSFGSSS